MRPRASTGGSGVLGYSWQIDQVPVTSYEAADDSAIGFDVTMARSYHVTVDVSGLVSCLPYGVGVARHRLRPGRSPTTGCASCRRAALAPPQEVVVQVTGGTNSDRPFALDPGTEAIGFVANGGTGVPAYLRFTPLVGPPVEAFSAADGSFDVRLQLQAHTVLIVPSTPGLAPRLTTWMPGITRLTIDAGSAVTGVVRDPSGTALAGATVALAVNGVPSTVATTAGDGSFTVRAVPSSGAPVTVTVTPPTTSGLARLTATAAYDLSQSLQISYAGGPATCDLAATPIKRAGANQPGAQVTLVGAIAGTFGSIATGGITQPATGSVLLATTANGAGVLPSTLVPRAPLSAVVELAPGDLAVAAIDTSTCAALTITAPAMIAANGTAMDPQGNAIAGVRVEATPAGALAMANLVPVDAPSITNGGFALQLASGGHYDLRFSDPAGRAAPLVILDATSSSVPSSAQLFPALLLTGLVSVLGDPNPIVNASVQILCSTCTGVDATRPIAVTATDVTSHYAVAVPDPGTM